MLYLRAFGGLSLENGGRPVVGAAAQRARLAILALLATAGDRGVSRDRVMALFWPDKDGDHARGALRQALYALRRDAGERELVLGSIDLTLNRAVIDADVLQFDLALNAGNPQRAVNVYGGALLDGVHLRDVPEFERWVERERDRKARQYRAALEQLATSATARGEHRRAAELWSLLASSDPLSATSTVAVMSAFVRAGDEPSALRYARDYERLVRAELEARPDPSVVALEQAIRAGATVNDAPPTPREFLGNNGAISESMSAADSVPESVAPGPRAAPMVARRRPGLCRAIVTVAGVVVFAGALTIFHAVRQARGHVAPVYRHTAIAILPFRNLSVDPSQAYLAAGIHDELLTQLSKVADLRVTSRQSVMAYAGSNTPLPQIARELAVGSVVQASMQVVGNRLRVNVQLIDANTDAHLWAEHYDRTIDDAFAIQSDIARRIAAAVDAALSGSEARALAAAHTKNAEAYRLYLQGRDYYTRPDAAPEAMGIAEGLYTRALVLDSTFALAHAALSELHGLMYITRYDRSPARATHQREQAEAALRLVPDLPEAHRAMGSWYYHSGKDYARALSELRVALAGLPNDVDVWARIGQVNRRMGNWNESLIAHLKTTELSPRNSSLFKELGVTYLWMHRYAEAATALDRALILAPDIPYPRLLKAKAYLHWRGQLDTLRAALEAHGWNPEDADWTLEMLDLVYWDRQADSMVSISKTAHSGVFEGQNFFVPASLYAAWGHRLRGDRSSTRRALEASLALVDSAIKERGDDERIHAARGLTLAGLGRRDEALAEASWLHESLPYRHDKFQGRVVAENRARIMAQLGETDAALDEIESLLAEPSHVSVHTLRLDPSWDPIRDQPRFRALLAKYAPR